MVRLHPVGFTRNSFFIVVISKEIPDLFDGLPDFNTPGGVIPTSREVVTEANVSLEERISLSERASEDSKPVEILS